MAKAGFDQVSVILVLSFVTLAGPRTDASAQDSHYWNHQYGTRANLLGGAVVGSLKDLSATYYNPAAIVPTIDSSVVISTEVLMFERIKVQRGAPDGLGMSSLQATTAPSILAVRIPFGGLREHQLAISYLSRHKFELELGDTRIDSDVTLSGGLYVQHFAGEFLALQKMNEDWGGITWARSLGEKARIGVTTYVAYRSQRGRRETVAQIITSTGTDATTILMDEQKFWNVRLLWKVGLAANIKPLLFGLTVTTPSVSLFGEGSSFSNISLFGLDLDDDGTADYELISNFQEDLPAYYRTPLSVALGASYGGKRTTFHFTAEWFNRVKKFDVMEIDDFIGQSTGQTISIDYHHELDYVFNVGIGLDHKVNEAVSLYGGFTTDYSAFVPGSDTKLAVTSWDIYHITAGSTLSFRALNIALGLGYSFGGETVEQLVDFSTASPENQLTGDGGENEVQYRRLKLIFGVSF